MTLKELKYMSETDDIMFKYKEKCYVICLLNDKYCTGESGNNDDNQEFNSFEEMSKNWIIQGQSLGAIVNCIEIV